MARLIVHLDEGPNTFVLNGERTVIGRDHACDIRIPHKAVAPRHCVIFREEDSYAVEQIDPDLYSLLNSSLLTRDVLRDADRLEIGKFVIEFHDDADFLHDACLFDPIDALLIPNPDATNESDTPPSEPPADFPQPPPPPTDPAPDPPMAHDSLSPSLSPPPPEPTPAPVADAPQPPPASPAPIVTDPSDPAFAQGRAWYVTRDDTEFGPLAIEMLIRMIDEGDVTQETLVRGPTNSVRPKPAVQVPGIARFFQVCHACRAGVRDSQTFCHFCGVNLTHVFVPRGADQAVIHRRSSLSRSAKTLIILPIALALPIVLYASGIWRQFLSPDAQAAVDAPVERVLAFSARIVGPDNFPRYRNLRELASRSARMRQLARAAELYDRIESAFPGTRFAENAHRERQDLLAALYAEANDAADQGDYPAAADKLAAASLDPVFFTLYPAAETKLHRWRSLTPRHSPPLSPTSPAP